jgi:rhodanese-related sulfurtransferase
MAIEGERIWAAYPSWDQKESHMKTIDPISLANLIAACQPLDLIDVRAKKEFDKMRIPGARSIPLSELRAPKFLRDRKLPATEPLYVICRSRVLAGLASGALEGAGCANAVVVEGGMENWEAQALPVVRRKWFPKITLNAPMMALIAGFGFGLGLAIHEIFFLVPLIIGAVALRSKIHSFAQRGVWRGHVVDFGPPSRVEDWVIPHLSRLASHLGGKDVFLHPHHVRFARSH